MRPLVGLLHSVLILLRLVIIHQVLVLKAIGTLCGIMLVEDILHVARRVFTVVFQRTSNVR